MWQFKQIFKSCCNNVNINLNIQTLAYWCRYFHSRDEHQINRWLGWTHPGLDPLEEISSDPNNVKNKRVCRTEQNCSTVSSTDLKQLDNRPPGGITPAMAFLVSFCGCSLKPQFSQFKKRNLAGVSHECHFDSFLYVCLNSDGCFSLSCSFTCLSFRDYQSKYCVESKFRNQTSFNNHQ